MFDTGEEAMFPTPPKVLKVTRYVFGEKNDASEDKIKMYFCFLRHSSKA